ncbi:MAG: L-serine ammonia-lyase [Gemmataceae bacterium]
MELSVFDLFKVGIGPSSSHTVGPMWAAVRFVRSLAAAGQLPKAARLRAELYGSLSSTGRGHATDKAVLLGLSGFQPDLIDPAVVDPTIDTIHKQHQLLLNGTHPIVFQESNDLLFRDYSLPRHPNGMRLSAFSADGTTLHTDVYYSVGGGFVVNDAEAEAGHVGANPPLRPVTYEFPNCCRLLELGETHQLSIAAMILANEESWRSEHETLAGLDRLWAVMEACIDRGCQQGGILPGGLNVRRRAAQLYSTLQTRSVAVDPMVQLDWVSLFALAVNEENAAGGRVVTAPTNGAAGVIPAVLGYYRRLMPGADAAGVRTFLLTAGAIGMLYKRNASLSAAEMGCQGEVGVACSMAAAGLAAVMGGNNAQIENAAEIGMEHNLGLTCDPIAGLVQVPCIERNTMGAAKAINAARLAVLHGDGSHKVPLDRVIETMRQTGVDMQDKYKETARGGLAVNVVNC